MALTRAQILRTCDKEKIRFLRLQFSDIIGTVKNVEVPRPQFEKALNGQVMFTYVYNVKNRLVKVEGGNQNVLAEYYYDPFGRRLWKDAGGTRTYFLYADEGLVAEYDANGTEIKSYGYYPDSTWTTDPLFLKKEYVPLTPQQQAAAVFLMDMLRDKLGLGYGDIYLHPQISYKEPANEACCVNR